ncbi:MobH family relaxase [Modicisalibacter xianhensis]|nr:MobH family relaxase [Halomonas xianhensis]
MLKALTQRLPFRRRKFPVPSATLTIDMLQGGDLELEDVPRYPPFAKGLPVAPLHHVMATQAELIQRIRMTLGLRSDQFQELVVPVLCRYAEFVHLLPASEAHHHRGAGGLFRHGLEVAFWAAQASEATIFTLDGTPQERRDNEPRWRLAVCMGGLLHDVGKPLYDVSVTDRSGKLQWNPFEESLTEWAIGHRLDRYFLRWNENRHKRHEKFSLLAIERIFTPEIRRFFGKPGPKVFESLLDALAGTSAQHPVSRLIINADQTSVRRDLVNNRLSVDEHAYGVPVEKYVFDAIRRLVKSGGWKCNEIGAEVWVVHQGVFINWRAAAPRLVSMLEKDEIPGIPRDADTLADILLERGFALYKPLPGTSADEVAGHRYWEVEPLLLQQGEVSAKVRMLMLRMESPELVFTTEPPAPVEARVVGDESEQAVPDHDVMTARGDAVGQGAQETSIQRVGDDSAQPSDVPTGQFSEHQSTSKLIPSSESPKAPAKSMTRPMAIDGFDLLASQARTGISGSVDGTEADVPVNENVLSSESSPGIVSRGSTLPDDAGSLNASSSPDQSPPEGLAALAALGQGVGFDFPFAASGGSADDSVQDKHGALDSTDAYVTKTQGSDQGPSPLSVTKSHETLDLPNAEPAKDASSLEPTFVDAALPMPTDEAGVETSPVQPVGGLGPSAMQPQVAATAKPVMSSDSGLLVPSIKSSKRKKRRANSTPEPIANVTPIQDETPDSESQAKRLLETELDRILSGEAVLGESLCLASSDVAILYPHGLGRMGNPAEMLDLLRGLGWLVPHPEQAQTFVQERQGTDMVVLRGPWAEIAKNRLKALEAERLAELEHVVIEPGQAPDAEPPPADECLPKLPEVEAQAPVKRRRRTHASPQDETMRVPSASPSRLSEVLTAPEQPTVDEEWTNATASMGLEREERHAETADDLAPPKATPERALEMLVEMIRKRSGRWLSGPVLEEGEFLVASDAAIHLLTGEYPELTKTKLQFAIPKYPGLYRKDNKLYLRKDHG